MRWPVFLSLDAVATSILPRMQGKVIMLRFGLVCSILFVLFLPFQALAWTPGLKEAADAFALGTATPTQEMMVFVHNKEINLLAQEGKISMSTYRNCQEEFFKLNEGFASKAVKEAGFDPSIGNRKYNPGTDTDVNVLGNAGKKVTLDDIKKIDGNYQKIVKEHFRGKGVEPPTGNINTETDFMPNPAHTDSDEFKKIVNYVNQNGGTAYTDSRAASAQSKLGTSRPLSFDEASSFSSTMKDMADMKIHKANALRAEAKSIRHSNPGHAEYLEAQARQFDYQAAKYHNRIDAANNHLRRQHGLPEKPRNITGFDQSADIIEVSGRNPFTGKDAATIHNLHQSALQSSTDDMIDTLVDIARQNPSKAAQIQKALGKEISRLPANRAGQAIERIENATKGVRGLDKTLVHGAVAEARLLKKAGTASSKWAAFKERMKNVTGINRMTKFSVVMTAGGAVLMAHQGVTITLNNVKATDTLWDYFRNCYYHAAWEGTGIGPAFEQAQREEIERYMKEFEAGQAPSMAKHVTFTLLKTGVYMGRDAIIGVLYLPDTVWEYFTQEKEMEGYAAMQNELARVMRQMIKDRQEFDQVLANMKKMGLHESDAKPFLDCLCRGCGGSLGGFFNPACTSDIGHGPCQCNGPLTIWKTPLPAGDKQAQHDCFNQVTRMRYSEAQAVFDQWRQKMVEENARSVQPELAAIKQDIANGKAMEDENMARAIADRFASIQELLLPQDADVVRSMVGPYLENHAVKNLQTGAIDRAVDNLDRVLNKIGAHSPQKTSDLGQRKAQYEKWAQKWQETKDKQFREIDELIRQKQGQRAKGEIEVLEYRMLKGPGRPLPPAVKDPAFLALKERAAELTRRYEQAMQDMWAEVRPLGPDREHRLAIPILEKTLEEWQHSQHVLEGLNSQLGYHRSELKKAEDKKKLGRQFEKNGDLAEAVREYEASLRIQKDAALAGTLDKLRGQLQKQSDARELWRQAQGLQQNQNYEEALEKYRAGLALGTDPSIQERVVNLEKFLADRKNKETEQTAQTIQSIQGNQPSSPANAGTGAATLPSASSGAAVPGNEGDMSGWTVNYGIAEEAAGWISTDPPSEGKTSYYIAPASLLGGWTGYRGLSFEKKSSGGTYQDPYSYGGDGDVVIESSRGTARFIIEPDHTGNWRQYSIAFGGEGWSLSGGAQSVGELLGNVTGFRIRAEYGAGKDSSALRALRLIGRSEAGSGPAVPGKPQVSFEIGNIYGVANGPTKPTVFTLNTPCILVLIQTYHWHSARGADPGTIALQDESGKTYGPWKTEGSPGQGGVPNAYWKARPMTLLPAGIYRVIDSDPSSWAHNPQSDGRGFTRVETLPAQ